MFAGAFLALNFFTGCHDNLAPCDELAVTSVRCMMSECQNNPANKGCQFCSTCVLQPDLEMCGEIYVPDGGSPYVCTDEEAQQALVKFKCDAIALQVQLQCIPK